MLLGLSSGVRILLAREPIDMRNSIDGLAAIVRNGWQEDLYAGHLFVFVSRRGDRLKILTWDAGGFVLTYKRLERGRFRMPQLKEGVLGAQLDATQLALLLDGIDLSHVRRPSKWSPPDAPAAPPHGGLLKGQWQRSPKTTRAPGAKKPRSSKTSSASSALSSSNCAVMSSGARARRCRPSRRN
ncbi:MULTISPECIES: IS66 family insertion sequence element accessory protein TnpB [Myxococcaceae]|uniref:IS66 family insertion sequence element accessory protein TnpB n=1 Tax=Myxococcaceae TaxID=31 RepID=UPI001E64D0B8|nr:MULTISPECIES: IS66 family insertion sequence element accessory protein TnpB [Myxococcaceae]